MENIITLPASVAIEQGDVISIIPAYEIEAVGQRSGRTLKIQFERDAVQPTMRRPIGIALNDAKPGHLVRVMTQGHISFDSVSQISSAYHVTPGDNPSEDYLDFMRKGPSMFQEIIDNIRRADQEHE